MTGVSTEHIEIVEGAGGPKARIKGHNVRVIDVADWYYGQKWSPEEIVENIPTITIADIFDALAYYHDHRDELEAKRARDDAFVEEFMRANPGRLEEIKRRRDGSSSLSA
jgi:uncharacterized protein (DUF433 family)